MPLYTASTMASTRTQIYLTTEQRKRLDELGKREGKSLAELIRTAVDRYLDEQEPDVAEILRSTFGIAPDFEVPPRRWGRDPWNDG
jgi:metal-responsive CopG/Arc/MetJ family transcriptional regulator